MPAIQEVRHGRPERYRIPAETAQSELEIKNSLFIGTVGHAADVEAATAFVERVRTEYADATHNAWAYRIDDGPHGLCGFSDDGEPGGTAGRPMLSVLEGSELLEVVAVVTRYFGGIKLGAGGLVRAYSAAVREAVHNLATVECVLHRLARIEVDYGLYGHLQYLLPRYEVIIEQPSFSDRVTLDIAVPYTKLAEVAELLRERTNGQLRLDEHWVGERYVLNP
ncbi:MAG: YigZ family protein [Chloroflexi bacterium]|nr:YigZ family protein [Chloroflexota bacterium]